MPGLVPGIHVLDAAKTWMAGTGPAMTKENDVSAYWSERPFDEGCSRLQADECSCSSSATHFTQNKRRSVIASYAASKASQRPSTIMMASSGERLAKVMHRSKP